MYNISKIKEKLIGNTFIDDIKYFNRISSTNQYSKLLPGEDNVLVISDYQSHGRGRFHRKWVSDPHKNLTFSIKLMLEIIPTNLFSLNFFFTYFLLDGIISYLKSLDKQSKLAYSKFQIKWPNDLIYFDKKFSGILIENKIRKKTFIIGIGVNVNQMNFKILPHYNVTSLKEITGHEISLDDLLIHIIIHFSQNLFLLKNAQFNKIFKMWKKKSNMRGKTISFNQSGGKDIKTQIIDFKEDGGIILKINNKNKTFYSGEIRISTKRMPTFK